MSTSYERTFRSEVLKECLGTVAGRFFRLGTVEGNRVCSEIGELANNLLLPEYDNDKELDQVDLKLKKYQKRYETIKERA